MRCDHAWRMIIHRSAITTAACMIMMAALAAGGAAQQQRHSWTRPGVLRFAEYSEPATLNPLLASSAQEDEMDALFSDLLIGTDEHGQPFPQLAERVPTVANGDISRDGKTVVFHLRRGVKWHDGVEFTSSDVRFSWRAVMNPANNVTTRNGYDTVSAVDTPDRYTAVVHLLRPYAPLLAAFFSSGTTVRIVPEHVLAKYPNINAVPYNQKPIGTGPFKVAVWNHGQAIEFEANDAYFLGRPKLRHISARIIPNTTTIGIQLRTHEIDLAQLDSSTYRDLRNDPDITVNLSDQYVFIVLTLNVQRPLLGDVRVRRAIARAIDRQSIVDRFTFGTGQLATGSIAPLSWAYSPQATLAAHDPQAVKDLLDQAGWKIGKDGIRTKGGARLAFEMVEPSGGTTIRGIDTAIQAMLHDAGIEATIHAYPAALLAAPKADGGIYTTGKFDLSIISWVTSADPDNSANFMCKYFPPEGENYSFYCNHAVDALEERALATYEQPLRKALYRQIDEQLAADVPVYFLYYPKRRMGYNPDLQGFTSNGITTTWNAYKWSL